jgi:hypothetical protein
MFSFETDVRYFFSKKLQHGPILSVYRRVAEERTR